MLLMLPLLMLMFDMGILLVMVSHLTCNAQQQRIRNILVDELVRHHTAEASDHEEIVVLQDLMLGNHQLQKVAERLQITMPEPRTIAGLVLERLYRDA